MPGSVNDSDATLVLFSGGQDSTTCLAWALSRYGRVETLAVDYKQRHAVELTCRKDVLEGLRALNGDWAARLGEDHQVDMGFLSDLGETAMTHDMAIEMTASGLPSTFVPGRNLAFLTAAAALAYRRGIGILIGGMCETDFSGYPDCRSATIAAMSEALSLGLDRQISVETPLMRLNKAETWALAEQLGGKALVELIIEKTHTCYKGDRSERHDWGYGCGTCFACELRANGYAQYRVA